MTKKKLTCKVAIVTTTSEQFWYNYKCKQKVKENSDTLRNRCSKHDRWFSRWIFFCKYGLLIEEYFCIKIVVESELKYIFVRYFFFWPETIFLWICGLQQNEISLTRNIFNLVMKMNTLLIEINSIISQ